MKHLEREKNKQMWHAKNIKGTNDRNAKALSEGMCISESTQANVLQAGASDERFDNTLTV